MPSSSRPGVPTLALEGIAKGEAPGQSPSLSPESSEQEAEPLLLVALQCESMLAQGARRWDLESGPSARCEELERTVRAALQSFDHAIYLRGMVEHAYDDEEGFHDKPPARSLLLVLRRACTEFASVRGDEEAFRVVAEYNRLGDAYAPDPDAPTPAVADPALGEPLELGSADQPTPLPEPSAESHSVSEWANRIGLGHLEGILQEKFYPNPDTASFSGPNGLKTLQSLDGDDMDDVVEMLNLSPTDETRFREEMFKLSKNHAHCPSHEPQSASKNPIVKSLNVLKSPRRSEADKAYELGKTAYNSRSYKEAVKHLTVALDKGTTVHRCEALIERGLAYAELERHQEAFDDFDVLCKEDPTNSYAFNNRGWKHMHFDRNEEAKADLLKALELNRNNSHAHGNLRSCLEKLYGAAVSDNEVRGAIRSSIHNQAKSKSGFVGLANQGATCYLNSLLQTLFMTPELRLGLYDWKYNPQVYEAVDKCIPAQLQRLFVNLQTSELRAIETDALTKSFGWTGMQAFEQQDVDEMSKILFDALEMKFKNTPQAGLVESLYTGEVENYVRCKVCGNKSATTETFTDLKVPIRPFGAQESIRSLEEGLQKYFQPEVLEGANQYHCDRCNAKCDADRGIQLSKVPYILTVSLTRFEYDWERDCRTKVDDEVTFPFDINMSAFRGSPDPEPELEPDADVVAVPARATASSEAAVPVVNRGFGKGNAGIGERGASDLQAADPDHPNSTLDYELFSILVHSGGALGGHYYCYIKDLKTKRWIHFNDEDIEEISEEKVRRAYGGHSTASAYMLFYRRVDPEVNVETVSEEDVPEGVLAEMNQEAEEARLAKEEKRKDVERRRNTYRLYLHCEEKLVQLEIDKHTTFGVLKSQVAEQFGLVGVFAAGNARLCMLHTMHDMPAAAISADDDAALAECKLDCISGSIDILVQLRPNLPAGAPAAFDPDNWDLSFGPELKSTGVRHHMSTTQLRVSLCTFVVGDPNPGGHLSDQLSLGLGQLALAATVTSSVVVRMREGSTVGDLRAAITRLFGLASGSARIVHSGTSTNRLIQDAEPDSALLREARIFNGDCIFVRNMSVAPPRLVPTDEESLLIDSINTIHIHYTDVNGSDFLHYMQVPKTISAKSLFAKLGSSLQVEERYMRVLDGQLELKRTPYRRRCRLKIKTSDESVTVPMFLWKGSEDASEYLFDMTVRENWLVTEFKEQVAAKLKAEKGIAMDPICMRAREIDGYVFQDSQTVLEAVLRFTGSEKLAVNALEGPETKASKNDVVLNCIRWYPSEYRLGEPAELVIDDHAQAVTLRQAILALPEAAGLDVDGMGLVKCPHSWTKPSILDVPDMFWDQDRALPKRDTWGYVRKPDTGIGWPKDCDTYYYRSNSEELKELTPEETAAIGKEAKKQARSSRPHVQEQGVRIHVEQGRRGGPAADMGAGAGQSAGEAALDPPPVGSSAVPNPAHADIVAATTGALATPLSLVTASQQLPSLERSVSASSVGAWAGDSGSSDGGHLSGNVSEDGLEASPIGFSSCPDPDRLAESQQTLVAMGYSAGDALAALQRANGDIGRAVEFLCGGGSDEEEADAMNSETFGDTSQASTRANVEDWIAENGGLD